MPAHPAASEAAGMTTLAEPARSLPVGHFTTAHGRSEAA
jgi:hypothetical protein